MEERKFGLGVFALILNQDLSKILLVKRNKQKREKHGVDWGNVGGRVELGEKIIDACIREAKEEIGININAKQLKFIKIIETPNLTPKVHAVHFAYTCQIDETQKIVLNEESDEYQWFNLAECPESMIDSKESFNELISLAKQALNSNLA